MPTDDPSRSSAEDFDPSQTLFFKRRKQNVNLLPLIVVCALILGSGALITWALTQSGRKPAEDTAAAKRSDPFAGRKILSPAEADSMANPPVAPAQKLEPVEKLSVPPPANAAASMSAATAAPFDESKPVQPAMPVTVSDNNPPPASSSTADASAPLNFSVQDPDNARVREEVLQRIDLMPGVSAANKDKLYASVDHARGMGRVLTIPFEKGEAAVRPADVERIKQQVQTPEIKKLVDDPTVVFVVLGYADQKGSGAVNSEVSLKRARSVMDALRDKCGFQNVMHSVAMGGSTLFSAQEAEKNRVAEIWAVLP